MCNWRPPNHRHYVGAGKFLTSALCVALGGVAGDASFGEKSLASPMQKGRCFASLRQGRSVVSVTVSGIGFLLLQGQKWRMPWDMQMLNYLIFIA